jgi:uncharacterized membrane protein YsdA (DUF1294 family)
MTVLKIILIYLLLINFVAFVTYGIDKWKAKHNKWRVPEKTLLGMALVGGSVGSLASMYTFHHKTKKWYFSILVPMMLIVHVALIVFLFYKGILKF